jgi:DNA-binding NarL/FixJ family response regulator
MSQISILLVDDHNIVRQGLKALLTSESDFQIVAEAQTGREAVQLAATHRPEIVIMDLAMPLLNGAEATRQILKTLPTAKVVVLSTYGDDEHIQQAIGAGAAAYLLKQSAAAELAGSRVPEIELTSREAEVLQLIAEGFANKQIASELGLSVKTVEKHRQQVMNKLNIHDIAGLVRHAAAKGIIEMNPAGVPAS